MHEWAGAAAVPVASACPSSPCLNDGWKCPAQLGDVSNLPHFRLLVVQRQAHYLLHLHCLTKKILTACFSVRSFQLFKRLQSLYASNKVRVGQRRCWDTCGKVILGNAFSQRSVPISTTIKPDFQKHFILEVKTWNSSPNEGIAKDLKWTHLLLLPNWLHVLASL